MIVPFLFDLYENSKQYPNALWVFYKFITFSKKYNFPIIAQEKYFEDLNENIDKNHSAKKEISGQINDYEIPSKNLLKNNYKYCITYEEEELLLRKYKEKDPWVEILTKNDNELENIIDRKIKMIIAEKGKIDAIITWMWNPSLEKVCKKNKIKLIQYELSTIRKPQFNMSLGYFQFENKYKTTSIKSKYEEFKKYNKLIFDREELLSMFLNTESLNNIFFLYKVPKYRLGYALGLDKDKLELAYSKFSTKEVFQKIKNKYMPSDVLIRPHPMSRVDIEKTQFVIDNSSSSAEWISKCEKIICNISNIAYEAMLYGKDVININDALPTSFNDYSDLRYFDEKKIGLQKLNFLTFYCYCPYDLMFNKEYIEYRLSNPSVIDIYNYHLKYILKQKNIDYDKIIKMKQVKRLDYILKQVHNLNDNEIKKIKKYSVTYTVDKLEKTINEQKKEISKLNNELTKTNNELNVTTENLNAVLNSTSWKLTKPMRKFMDRIRRRKWKK